MPSTPVNTLADLIQLMSRGGRPKFLFFWGHTPASADIVDKSCLSQWFPAAFEVDGVRYATAEHYMMAQKALLFGDQDAYQRMLLATHPNAVKQIGREVRGFEPARWEANRTAIVVAGNLAKFSQSPPLRDYLLTTGERILVEASPVDAVWGTGLAADHPHAAVPGKWPGLNLLGFALMQARAHLQAEP